MYEFYVVTRNHPWRPQVDGAAETGKTALILTISAFLQCFKGRLKLLGDGESGTGSRRSSRSLSRFHRPPGVKVPRGMDVELLGTTLSTRMLGGQWERLRGLPPWEQIVQSFDVFKTTTVEKVD